MIIIPDQVLINKKKTCPVDFAVPAGRRVTVKESEKINKYLDLARELKKYCEKMWMTVIPIVGPQRIRKRTGTV